MEQNEITLEKSLIITIFILIFDHTDELFQHDIVVFSLLSTKRSLNSRFSFVLIFKSLKLLLGIEKLEKTYNYIYKLVYSDTIKKLVIILVHKMQTDVVLLT